MKKEPPKVTIELVTGGWVRALNLARRTIGKEKLDKEPSMKWKLKMLIAEHSPIRVVEYVITIEKIRQWVTTHIVRHWLGWIPFVHSQRQDRRELHCDRDELPQGSLNDMDVYANAQAMINISRKRLCHLASVETQEAWRLVVEEMQRVDPAMASACVPNCIYRGFCPEGDKSCGYYKSEDFKKKLEEYRKLSPNE